MPIRLWDIRAESPQFILSQFLLLDKFFIGKRKVKDYERRVLTLVNLTPDYLKYPITRLLIVPYLILKWFKIELFTIKSNNLMK